MVSGQLRRNPFRPYPFNCLATLFFLAPLVIQSWQKGPAIRRLPVFLVPFTPLLGIGLFLAWPISQGFIDFMALQAQDWGKNIVPLWMILPMAVKETYFTFRIWLNLAFFIIAVSLTPFVWKRMDWGMALYLLISSLFLASNANYGEPLPSFIRYVLPLFPLFIALALLLRKKVHWLAFLFGTIQLFLCGFFLMWLWVG
jgi:hypothetical protein